MRKRRIGVLGNSVCSREVVALAEAVGRGIARRDALLVCGGMTGVMEGAARGAKEAGGKTIGILPGNKADDANPYIDIPVVTGMGKARNSIVVLTSEVVIAIHGQYGTLTEVAYALHFGIPVVSLNSWQVSEEIVTAKDPADAVKKAFELLSG